MSASQSEEVVAAIAALYGAGDSSLKAAANEQLTRLVRLPDAWPIGLSLLDHGSVEVRYFSANMLLSKVRSEWHHVTPDLQSALVQETGRCLFTLSSQTVPLWVVVNRLCLLMAAMACRTSNPNSPHLTTTSLLESALQMAIAAERNHSQATIALALLEALVEEVHQVDHSRQLAAQRSMSVRTSDVFQAIDAALSGKLGAGQEPRLSALALRLLLGWLQSVSVGMTAGGLAQSFPDLYQRVLSSTGSTDGAVLEAAVEVVVLLVSLNQVDAAQLGAEEKAVQMVMAAVANQRGSLPQALEEDGECQLARGLCEMARAVSEHWWELVAKESKNCPEAVPLADIMLTCLSLGGSGVAEIALDYFTMLNMVPLSETVPALHAPLYLQLLQGLLKQSAYPADFTTWQESSGDRDNFSRFRQLFAAEMLETCYTVLGTAYLATIQEHLSTARSWQAVEVALFALRSAAHTATFGDASIDDEVPNATLGSLNDFFVPLFAQLAGDQFVSHPLVAAATANLVGAFGSWISNHPESLDPALGFLLRGLQTSLQGKTSAVWKASARAFRALCATCTHRMAQPALLEQLIQAVESSLPPLSDGPSAVDVNVRTDVNDGLANLIAALPFDEASRFGVRLVTPVVTSLGKAAGAPPAAGLVTCLTLLAGAIRHLEFSRVDENEARKPCAALVQFSWPTLDTLLASPQVQPHVEAMGALCRVYTRALQIMGPEALPAAELTSPLVSIFERFQLPECVLPLVTAVQSSSKSALEAQADFHRGVLGAVARVTFGCLQRGELPKRPEVPGALFSLASAYVAQFPPVVVSGPLLPSLMQAAAAVVRCQDKESSKSALEFFSGLFEVPARMLEQRPVIEGALQVAGQELTTALLIAAGDKLPRQLVRNVGAVLYSMAQYSPAAVGVWAASSFADSAFLGVNSGALTDTDERLVIDLMRRQPPLPKRRFEGLISDVASICRREAMSDTLLAYQIT